MTYRWMTRIVTGGVVALLLTSAALAQWPGGRSGFGRFRYPPRFRPAGHLDQGFTFCRLMYTSTHRDPSGRGWSTDYPFADINFMIRLSELTSTRGNFDDAGDPNHWVIRISDDDLFTCPFVAASDVGTMILSPEEAARLRDYLLKGGFLWVDDFWGTRAWDQWVGEISKVLPPSEYPIVDVPDHSRAVPDLLPCPGGPADFQHPLLATVRRDHHVRTGLRQCGATLSGHHRPSGRILVAMTHNTDIQDAWEREGEDQNYFERFSPDGYALGVNVVLHAMTH